MSSKSTGNPGLPAAVGFDLGITGSRASILLYSARGNRDEIPVTVTRKDGAQGSDKLDGNHPATAYPFLTDLPVEKCIGENAPHHEDSVPLKMHVYVARWQQLRGAFKIAQPKALRHNVPQLNAFLTRLETSPLCQEKVLAHLGAIFVHHLEVVRQRVLAVAKARSWRITKLVATIPSWWEEEMQQIYRKLLVKVWSDVGEFGIDNVADSCIHLLTEVEALGHWQFRLHNLRFARGATRRFVMVDFGAHALSIAYFAAVPSNKKGHFVFFACNDSDYHYGGSEMHTDKVKGQVDKFVQTSNFTEDEGQVVSTTLMEYYHDHQRDQADGSMFKLLGRKSQDSPRGDLELPYHHRTTRSMYDKAFEKPLEYLSEKLAENSELSKDTLVMACGGGFENESVLKKAKRIVKGVRGMRFEASFDDLRPAKERSTIISQGAVLAIVNSITVDQFVRQAAFAIDFPGNQSDNLGLILHNHESRITTLDFSNTPCHELRVVCAPFAPHKDAKAVARRNTSLFESVVGDFRGKYLVDMEFVKPLGKPRQLILRLYKGMRMTGLSNHHKRWEIYYDCGTGRCLVDKVELANRIRMKALEKVDASAAKVRKKMPAKGLKGGENNVSGDGRCAEDSGVVESTDESDGSDSVDSPDDTPVDSPENTPVAFTRNSVAAKASAPYTFATASTTSSTSMPFVDSRVSVPDAGNKATTGNLTRDNSTQYSKTAEENPVEAAPTDSPSTARPATTPTDANLETSPKPKASEKAATQAPVDPKASLPASPTRPEAASKSTVKASAISPTIVPQDVPDKDVYEPEASKETPSKTPPASNTWDTNTATATEHLINIVSSAFEVSNSLPATASPVEKDIVLPGCIPLGAGSPVTKSSPRHKSALVDISQRTSARNATILNDSPNENTTNIEDSENKVASLSGDDSQQTTTNLDEKIAGKVVSSTLEENVVKGRPCGSNSEKDDAMDIDQPSPFSLKRPAEEPFTRESSTPGLDKPNKQPRLAP